MDYHRLCMSIGRKAIVIEAYSYEVTPTFLYNLMQAKNIPCDRMLVFYDGSYEFGQHNDFFVEV